jgi:hypothetical protein
MNGSRFLALALAGGLLLAHGGPARAYMLVGDDFNDNSIDTSKWQVVIPSGSNITQTPSVTEQNGRIELFSRGYLVTAQQFDPADYSQGIEITGEWTFANGDDFVQILTRSDALPVGGYGETNKGVEFFLYRNDGNSFTIRGRGASVMNLVATRNLSISDDDTFRFRIFDDGTNLAFDMVEVGDPSSWASATATSTTAMSLDYIVFHNRENGSRTSYLDNVRIEALPEPGTVMIWSLLAAAGIALPCRRRRR